MSKVNFTVTPAFSLFCDVCRERFVGGEPDNDEATHNWMAKHAKWHESSQLVPPKDILLP